MGGNSSKAEKPQPDLNVSLDLCNDLRNLKLEKKGEENAENRVEEVTAESVETGSEVVENGTCDNEGEPDEEGDQDSGNPDDEEEGEVTLPPPVSPEELLIAEHVIAAYRAKLYRFEAESKEWKEKGVGRIHILESIADENQHRVVMWADGTGRVVCNFRLGPEAVISRDESKPKTASWSCADFTDSEETSGKREVFACRFGKPEECQEFMKLFSQFSEERDSSPVEESEDNEPENDIGEANCDGCVGCDPDEFQFPQVEVVAQVESLIEDQLGPDSCTDKPAHVEPAMFRMENTSA